MQRGGKAAAPRRAALERRPTRKRQRKPLADAASGNTEQDAGADGAGSKRPRIGGGGGKQRNISKDRGFMIRVVESRYCHEGQQTCRSFGKVARDLGESRQAVIAAHDEAVTNGLVEFRVRVEEDELDIARLAPALKRKFPLQEVMIVAGRREMLTNLDRARRRSVHTEINRAMAALVIKHLDALLRAHQQSAGANEKFVLGVSWGRTMQCIAETLRFGRRPMLHSGPLVVPIVGPTSGWNPEPVEANVIAMEIARAYGGVSAQLPCPAFVPVESADMLTRSKPVQDMLREIRGADAVITSMGPIPGAEDGADDITLSGDRAMNEDLHRSALKLGAIGEICFWCWDAHGRQVRTHYRSIGLGFDGLQTIARDPKRQVILVSGGDRRRFEPLRVALQAGLASVLVTDTITARYLNGELPEFGKK